MAQQSILLLMIGDEYEFFTTPSALYATHTAQELGITRESLNNYFSRLGATPQKVYQNERCKIVKGALVSGTRGGE